MVQKITIGNQNRYFKLNTAVAPQLMTGGDTQVTAKPLQALELAEVECREIATLEADDPEVNDFLTKIRFDKHIVWYDPNEVAWLACNLK
jgi:hypothetical protein